MLGEGGHRFEQLAVAAIAHQHLGGSFTLVAAGIDGQIVLPEGAVSPQQRRLFSVLGNADLFSEDKVMCAKLITAFINPADQSCINRVLISVSG